MSQATSLVCIMKQDSFKAVTQHFASRAVFPCLSAVVYERYDAACLSQKGA